MLSTATPISPAARIQQEAKLAATLARAKEALIARAVTDANRPGSLPCPDLITNDGGLSNFPGDGKADMFTLTQCPSYVGWLPWVTLDLPELSDDTGTRLWYALSPELRDDDSAQPINSDRALAQQLDGAADIAAVIIASRARHRQPGTAFQHPFRLSRQRKWQWRRSHLHFRPARPGLQRHGRRHQPPGTDGGRREAGRQRGQGLP